MRKCLIVAVLLIASVGCSFHGSYLLPRYRDFVHKCPGDVRHSMVWFKGSPPATEDCHIDRAMAIGGALLGVGLIPLAFDLVFLPADVLMLVNRALGPEPGTPGPGTFQPNYAPEAVIEGSQQIHGSLPSHHPSRPAFDRFERSIIRHGVPADARAALERREAEERRLEQARVEQERQELRRRAAELQRRQRELDRRQRELNRARAGSRGWN